MIVQQPRYGKILQAIQSEEDEVKITGNDIENLTKMGLISMDYLDRNMANRLRQALDIQESTKDIKGKKRQQKDYTLRFMKKIFLINHGGPQHMGSIHHTIFKMIGKKFE